MPALVGLLMATLALGAVLALMVSWASPAHLVPVLDVRLGLSGAPRASLDNTASGDLSLSGCPLAGHDGSGRSIMVACGAIGRSAYPLKAHMSDDSRYQR